MNVWTREWPTEPGWYWFYGRRSKSSDKPRLEPAQIRRGSNTLFVVCAGAFMYQEEGADGWWLAMDVPTPPPYV